MQSLLSASVVVVGQPISAVAPGKAVPQAVALADNGAPSPSTSHRMAFSCASVDTSIYPSSLLS